MGVNTVLGHLPDLCSSLGSSPRIPPSLLRMWPLPDPVNPPDLEHFHILMADFLLLDKSFLLRSVSFLNACNDCCGEKRHQARPMGMDRKGRSLRGAVYAQL